MSDTPEIIYLIHGEYEGEHCRVWCDDPAPSSYNDPAEAVKYVRADIHESALKRQGNAAKMGMDAAKKDAIWREENAKRLLTESNPAAIESERAMNAELTAENERLQSRVVELERQGAQSSGDEDARFNQVVFLVDALRQSTHGKEIVEQASGNQIMDVELRDYLEDFGLLPVSCERLRSKADKAGGDL
jgi:sRNA-binding carbon storage regulator CsrA